MHPRTSLIAPQSIETHPDGKKTPKGTLSRSSHLHNSSNPILMGRARQNFLLPASEISQAVPSC